MSNNIFLNILCIIISLAVLLNLINQYEDISFNKNRFYTIEQKTCSGKRMYISHKCTNLKRKNNNIYFIDPNNIETQLSGGIVNIFSEKNYIK